MKFSILPNNFTDTVDVEVSSVRELANAITENHYSGGIFKNNYTNNENFLSTELLILDYDNYPGEPQLSLEDALKKFAPYKCIIATTRNHRREKKSGKSIIPAADRFRVVLFLSRPIQTIDEFTATWFAVSEQFPGCDQACKDPARRLYKSLEVRMVNEEGRTIEPVAPKAKAPVVERALPDGVEHGILSRKTLDFMQNGAVAGTWNARLYLAARDYQEQMYSKEEFIEAAEKITGHLDSKDLATIDSAFNKPPKYAPRVQEAGDAPAVERWVRQWLDENQVSISYKTGEITYNGKREKTAFIVPRMVLDAKAWAENNPIIDDKGNKKPRPPYGRESLEHAYIVWKLEQDAETVQHYRDYLAYNPVPGAADPVAQWVKAVTGTDSDLDVAVMRHFIWQVKRKLNDMEVEHHIMPVVMGKTGGGKTVAINKLLQPLEELTFMPGSLTMLDDSREAFVFGRFFVLFFDEMARAEKVNVASLKNKITSHSVSYRLLGTNQSESERNVASFIGAANAGVRDLIYDPTSARRFWQVNAADKLDHDTINSLDYAALWRSVDENADAPIKPHLGVVQQIQHNELRAKSFLEIWLDEDMEGCGAYDKPTPLTVLHQLFMDWQMEQGIKANGMTREFLGRQLKALGVPFKRTNTGMAYLVRERLGKPNPMFTLNKLDDDGV